MSKPHNPEMQELATELGFICIYWGWIEDSLDTFITELAELEHDQIAQALTGNVDVRQKIHMAKALSFLRQDASGEWYKHAIKTLNVIDNDLRPKRNRYIHAAWYRPRKRIYLHKKIVKISKPQAFMPEELTTLDRRLVNISTLAAFKKRLIKILKELTFLSAYQFRFHYYASHRISFSQFRRRATFNFHPKDSR